MITNARLRLAVFALLFAALPASAQERPNLDPTRPGITRAELIALRALLDSAAQSTAYGPALRTQARYQAGEAQARLTDGDFQVGDRVILSVEGQQALADTFDIGAGRILALPVVGSVSLKGVLRTELESHLKTHIAKIIVDPVVLARPLIRIAVIGEVREPGYYAISIDAPLTDAVMEARGPTAAAALGNIRIERGTSTLYSGSTLQQAIADGKTLDDMNLRAGDRLVVPPQPRRGISDLARTVMVALPTLAFLFTRF